MTKIGRNPELVDVVLNSVTHSNMISRDHSQITGKIKEDGSGYLSYFICDTSLNGTYVNDSRVKMEKKAFSSLGYWNDSIKCRRYY